MPSTLMMNQVMNTVLRKRWGEENEGKQPTPSTTIPSFGNTTMRAQMRNRKQGEHFMAYQQTSVVPYLVYTDLYFTVFTYSHGLVSGTPKY
jgi:hypothetical protein